MQEKIERDWNSMTLTSALLNILHADAVADTDSDAIAPLHLNAGVLKITPKWTFWSMFLQYFATAKQPMFIVFWYYYII